MGVPEIGVPLDPQILIHFHMGYSMIKNHPAMGDTPMTMETSILELS